PSARAGARAARPRVGRRSRRRAPERRRREPQALITDVPGIRVGHATDLTGLTGVTVVLCDRPAVCGAELRGGANDVVGLDYLDPRHLVPTVDGVVLGGGSRFGGEAIWGVMRWLEARGRGFAAGPTVVPHVPGAFIFDLNVGDGRARPTREMGGEAAAGAAAGPVAEGNVGAGTGASVGKVHRIARAMRGGIGSASRRLGDVVVGALVVVNAVGDVRALSPPHTAFDGDTLFALSVGDLPADITRLGLAAADAVAHAIVRGVRAATTLPGLPAARELE